MKEQYLFIENKEECYTIIDSIEAWLNSGELANIVSSFGGKVPKGVSLREKAGWLLSFSECWDYRNKQKTRDQKTGENARWKVNNDGITEKQCQVIKSGISALGLLGVEQPKEKEFDYIIALGGARFSCLYRPQYINHLITQTEIKTKEIILLSGMREILESERSATDLYAPEAFTEYDLINAGAEQVFRLGREYYEERYCHQNSNLNWAVRNYVVDSEKTPVISLSGPSSEPDKRRANSSDTYKFFIQKKNVEPGTKLLLVTSQIYVPYQQLEAIRTLAEPYGLYIETVGFPHKWSNKLQGMMEPANYLQEIRSTIQAINRYLF